MSSTLPPAILIGYCAKKVEKLEWLSSPNIEEVCSVSNCFSRPPEASWEWHPALNAIWLYRNDSDPLDQCTPYEDRKDFDLFAYKILPMVFGDEGEQLPLQDDETPIINMAAQETAAMPGDYEFLGHDCLAMTCMWGYGPLECSPLSCYSMSNSTAVNKYCLIDERERAIEFASRSANEDKDATYIVEVWRKRRVPA
jgi:hypothetical protein